MKSSLASLCGLHLLGNALILWIGYWWLGLPESDAVHLLGSVLVVLLFVGSALWLHGTALVFFRSVPHASLSRAAATALRRLPALFALAVVTLLLYYGLRIFQQSLAESAFRLASWLTFTLRKPVPPPLILSVFDGIFWLIRWLVLPAVLAPVAAQLAAGQFHWTAARPKLSPSLRTFIFLLGAVWLPARLMHWVPEMPNFSAEMASFVLRAAVSYLLFVGCLLLLERITASGIPSFTQRSSSETP